MLCNRRRDDGTTIGKQEFREKGKGCTLPLYSVLQTLKLLFFCEDFQAGLCRNRVQCDRKITDRKMEDISQKAFAIPVPVRYFPVGTAFPEVAGTARAKSCPDQIPWSDESSWLDLQSSFQLPERVLG